MTRATTRSSRTRRPGAGALTRGRLGLLATTALVASVALAGCGSDDGGGDDPFSSGGSDSDTIVVGSANFPESELLMQIYAQALDAKGVKTETKPNIGSREVYQKAFEDGDIDLLPEYNGALLAYFSPNGEVPEGVSSPEQVEDALDDVLPEGTEVLDQSAAEDKDTVSITQATSDKYALTSLADLSKVSDQLVIGAGPEFKTRYQGLVGLEKVYGVTFKQFKSFESGGALTVAALTKNDIQAANIYSTDSAIEVNDLVVLEDPENLFLAQNVVPFIREDKVDDTVENALDAVSAALTTENLTEYLAKVQVDKKSPESVAKEFLEANDLL